MAKRFVRRVVEPQTDSEKLAALMQPAVPATPSGEVIPTIPVEDAPVAEPTPTPVVPVSADQVAAFLAANPDFLRDAIAKVAPQATTQVTLRPTVTKSAQREGYVNLSFTEKPSNQVIADLKAAKYRWSPYNKVWYGPADALANHAAFGADIRSALQS